MKKGLSLIILAIFVAVAIPICSNYQNQTKAKKAKENFDIAVRYIKAEASKGNRVLSAKEIVAVLNKDDKRSPCDLEAPAFRYGGPAFILLPERKGQIKLFSSEMTSDSHYNIYYKSIIIIGDFCADSVPSIDKSVTIEVNN